MKIRTIKKKGCSTQQDKNALKKRDQKGDKQQTKKNKAKKEKKNTKHTYRISYKAK